MKLKNHMISCIMPTANRQKFIQLATHYFCHQSYTNTELIIIDDGEESVRHLLPPDDRIKYYYFPKSIGKIGTKRNLACERASGNIIVHWDDDDYYGIDWIKRSVHALESTGADICGLNEFLFYSPLQQKFWKYVDHNEERPWLAGATMVYSRAFWKAHPFKDIQIGEDYDYIWNNQAKIYAHDYTDGFIATLHSSNTTLKPFENSKLKKNASLWMDSSLQDQAKEFRKK
jgi:glycosyltransferase involved in cell wall biosynthesis